MVQSSRYFLANLVSPVRQIEGSKADLTGLPGPAHGSAAFGAMVMGAPCPRGLTYSKVTRAIHSPLGRGNRVNAMVFRIRSGIRVW
jgi:hypothetical protein